MSNDSDRDLDGAEREALKAARDAMDEGDFYAKDAARAGLILRYYRQGSYTIVEGDELARCAGLEPGDRVEYADSGSIVVAFHRGERASV